jgi:lipopolysaccharide biosynthesis protein
LKDQRMLREIGRWFKTNFEKLKYPFELGASFAYSLSRNALPFTRQTIKALPAKPDPAFSRLVLFAHYDPQDEVDEYVRFYLEKLYEMRSTIIFVSGSPQLKAASANKIRHLCAGIFTRRTLSNDFGNWHLAWQHLQDRGWKLERFHQFVLANDSVYGPLFPLSEIFGAFTGADMYGVTESNERGNHLQSYFLAWDLNQKTCSFLDSFWGDFRYMVLKQDLIDRYEIGISQRARAHGLQLKAYISDTAVRAAVRRRGNHQYGQEISHRNVNNTLYFWDVLIEDFRCPFIKTDLPRRNRYNSNKIGTLSTELRKWTEYNPTLIEANLEHLGVQK